MTSAYIIPNTIKCKYCPRFLPAQAMARGSEAEGYMCPTCYYDRMEALRKLGLGQIKLECADCQLTGWQALAMGQTMKMHRKDGTWQYLCQRCSARYEPRAGVYDGTLYAHIKKLKGYK